MRALPKIKVVRLDVIVAVGLGGRSVFMLADMGLAGRYMLGQNVWIAHIFCSLRFSGREDRQIVAWHRVYYIILFSRTRARRIAVIALD